MDPQFLREAEDGGIRVDPLGVDEHGAAAPLGVGAGDHHPFMALVALHEQGVSVLEVDERLEVMDPAKRDRHDLPAAAAFEADPREGLLHAVTP